MNKKRTVVQDDRTGRFTPIGMIERHDTGTSPPFSVGCGLPLFDWLMPGCLDSGH